MSAGTPGLPALEPALWRSRTHAPQAVRYFTEVLEHRRPGVLDRLRDGAEAEIGTWDDLDIVLVPDTDESVTTSRCSTAGMYDSRACPPRLVVARSPSRGRYNFTILHELAHHLQRTDETWFADVLADLSSNDAYLLEHRICDELASTLLLPDTIWSGYTTATVTAGVIRDLHAAHQASRAALLVRAVRHLPSGAVAFLLDPSGEVMFNQACGDDLAPPPRGSGFDQDLVRRARTADRREVTGELDFTYRSGATRRGVTATAAADDWGYVFVVAAQDQQFGRTAEWGTQTLDSTCGAEYTAGTAADICCRCQQPLCPECTTCPCRDDKTKVCARCYLALSVADIVKGRTEQEDCA